MAELKSLIEIVKVFLEKHFIPFILSIPLTFGVLYLVPSDFSIKVKIGDIYFIICIWAIIFLLILLVNKYWVSMHAKAESKRHRMEAKKNDLETLWKFVDKLPDHEYRMLEEFLKNGNSPIVTSRGRILTSLLNSHYVHSSEPKHETTADLLYDLTSRNPRKQYVLKQESFELLKYSQAKYGRLCHFKR